MDIDSCTIAKKQYIKGKKIVKPEIYNKKRINIEFQDIIIS